VEVGDILYALYGATSGEVGISQINGAINQAILAIQPKCEYDSNFIMQWLRRQKNSIISTYLQGGQGNLSGGIVKDLTLYAPTEYEEQKKIGTSFKQIDDAIALHHHKLELLKQAKQGFLQQMFPKEGENVPELRFANFSEAWEQRKLKEISEKVTNKNKEIEFTETLTNSAEFGIISQTDFFDKEISNKKNIDSYYIVKPDDFVYNPRISNYAPVGPIKRNNLGRTGIMSPLYYVFTTKEINKNFLEKYFDSTNWHKFMKLNGDSGARSDRFAIKDSIFVEMPISCPSSKEQQAIGQFFKQIDDTITLYQQKLTDLEVLKQAYLQKMFI
jgi:type I restriction enzyme S subunit